MSFIETLQRTFNDFKRRKVIEILVKSEPEALVAYGEKQLLKSFRLAAERIPAYKKLLEQQKVPFGAVRDTESFKNLVPIICKDSIFPVHELKDLCIDGTLQGMRSIMTSSGFSGKFAYGVSSRKNRAESVFAIDTTLDYIFSVSRKKTLFINSLPMGVTIPTSLPVADTSVRSDMALAIFTKLRNDFEQFLFISDPHFLKKILEDGLEQGIDWKTAPVHLITGDDWVPETFRSYLGNILGTDWERSDRGFIGGTMGVCELGLSLFHETPHSVRIQRLAAENRALRYALYGANVDNLPTLFHYYPHRTFLELAGAGNGPRDLLISSFGDSVMMPMFRYDVGDLATIIPYRRLAEILSGFGYEYLIPDLKLPLVAIFGRSGRVVSVSSGSVAPEQIKQNIYCDHEVAAATTGHFKLGKEGDSVLVEVQLKKGVTPVPALSEHCRVALLKNVAVTSQIKLYQYQQYPYQMEIDYEKKFKNMD